MNIDIVKIKELEERVKILRSVGTDGFYESIRITDDYIIQGGREFGIRDNFLQLNLLVKGKSVVDFGCNMGGVCIDTKRAGAKRVVGIELSEAYVKEAKNLAVLLGLDIEYYSLNLNLIDKEDFYKVAGNEKFDVVFMLSIWRHIDYKKFFTWTNDIIGETLVFEGHEYNTERTEVENLLKEHFTLREIKYVGSADGRVGRPTGRPLFICRK